MRIAILGGSFDPPHLGHLELARAALRELALDRVLFVPSRISPHKEGPAAGAYHRYAMTALCCAGEPTLVAHPVELLREGPSYTLHTLEALEEQGMGPLVVLVGADMLEDFPSWHRPREVLERAALAAAPRDGWDTGEVLARSPDWLRDRIRPAGEAAASGLLAGDVVLLSHVPPDVSSSGVRARIGRGEDVSSMLPAGVGEYVRKAGLYRGGAA